MRIEAFDACLSRTLSPLFCPRKYSFTQATTFRGIANEIWLAFELKPVSGMRTKIRQSTVLRMPRLSVFRDFGLAAARLMQRWQFLGPLWNG